MAFKIGNNPNRFFDPNNYIDEFGTQFSTDPNAPRRYYDGPGGGYGQGVDSINFLRPRNQKITTFADYQSNFLNNPFVQENLPKPLEKTPEQLEEERPRGTYFGSDETQQKQFNLDTYTKAPPGVLFGESDSRFETPAMRVARREAGDLKGPGMGSSLLGKSNNKGLGNDMRLLEDLDPRLRQGFGEDASKLPATGPRSRINNPTSSSFNSGLQVIPREPSNMSLGLPKMFGS